MNLKELINEVERLKRNSKPSDFSEVSLCWIKQTVEAVDKDIKILFSKDWQKLKKLLGLK